MKKYGIPIDLNGHTPFSSGGNRDCYVHPSNPFRCLKVLREGRSPSIRRREKSFPSNLRPLRCFDENLIEYDSLAYIFESYPDRIQQYLPRVHGFIETSRGTAIETDLIRNHDQLISLTLEQEIWQNGYDIQIRTAVENFLNDWELGAPTTRAFIPHNFLIKRSKKGVQIKVIDGLGRNSPWIRGLEKFLNYNRFNKRKSDLLVRIERIVEQRQTGAPPPDRVSNLRRKT